MMKKETEMKKTIRKWYDDVGVKRRFRQVSDGLWIFAPNTPAGIFISSYDYKENKKFTKRSLLEIDDGFRDAYEKKYNVVI